MHAHPYFPYFYDSLPVAGVEGTVRKRIGVTEAGNEVRAKTGYLKHVLNLSGYIVTQKEKIIVFSIMNNNFIGPARELKKLQDGICETLRKSY